MTTKSNLMAENPGVRFYNGERGYVRCTVTPEAVAQRFSHRAAVSKPGAPV